MLPMKWKRLKLVQPDKNGLAQDNSDRGDFVRHLFCSKRKLASSDYVDDCDSTAYAKSESYQKYSLIMIALNILETLSRNNLFSNIAHSQKTRRANTGTRKESRHHCGVLTYQLALTTTYQLGHLSVILS